MRHLLIPGAFLLLAPALALSASAAIDPDIAEAVFRYQFRNNESGQKANAALYCLEIAGGDPEESFIHRFAGHIPSVWPASRCSVQDMKVQDRDTGASALLFRITRIVDRSDTAARAEGGYYETGRSASGTDYILEKRDGQWSVVSARLQWIK